MLLEPPKALRRNGPVPYLVVGLAWLAFLMIAFKVRMIEPVFLWVLTQWLLVEKTGLSEGLWRPVILLLTAYMAAGLLAWWLVERSPRDPQHVWRRAVASWIVIQGLYSLTATLLVQTGILYE